MNTDPIQETQPQNVEQRKSRLMTRIQNRLLQVERRLKILEIDLVDRVESVTRSEAGLRAAEADYQRQLETVRAAWTVLDALEHELDDLEPDEAEAP